ncbi:MAG: serine/threonine protein kinase [Planctomycetaceae bacterium]|nr:serine/threonine protein kinase [Planctomycetaceae bacterium]
MSPVTSTDALKSFLLTHRLIAPDDWLRVAPQLPMGSGVAAVLETLERQQLLTSLQTSRILKGETEGLVLGKYKLLYRNASGSFARVFRAASVEDNSMVALKLLRERWANDAQTVASFNREARLCQKFIHPNIVPIYEIGNEGRFHFFTMEFVEGGNLKDFMAIRKKLSPVEACRCMYHICSALHYALGLGATHRDLKLTNVLMSSTGVAKLVDFGLAGAESPSQAGTSDTVQRALEYASLERGTNAPRDDPRSDLFFAGAIFYELLTGEGPWPRTRDREERLQLSRYTNIRPLSQLDPSLPAAVTSICARMMQVSPSARYQGADEIVAELKPVLAQLGEPVEPVSTRPLTIEQKPDFHLLIADSIAKRCQMMQQYFEKHGYTISFVQTASAALNRLKGNTRPDGILILADSDPLGTLDIFPQIQAYARSAKVPCAAVFAAENEDAVRKTIVPTRFGATLFQPATLRDLRNHFDEIGAITR